MNDKSEFNHADELIIALIKEGARKVPQYEVNENFQSTIKGIMGDEFYVFSATQHPNDYEKEHGSLVMWRGYGNKPGRSGCAIVFKKEILEELVRPLILQGFQSVFGKVDYISSNERPINCAEYCQKIIKFGEYLAKNVKILHPLSEQEKEKYYKYNPIPDFSKYYHNLKGLVKHPAFHSESEYRMAIYKTKTNDIKLNEFINSERKKFEQNNKTKIKNINIENNIAQIPLYNDSDISINKAIKKIIVSPIGDYQDINVDFLKQFIQSDPRYHGIEVTKSEIPHQ